ncbi:MAG TPA: hypothetical protein VK100_04345 [Pseudogracilibacillus sp.]|nr:hypothetical protein [Pseudogracilibacillus sp.]
MANHLSAHKSIIKRLELYTTLIQNSNILSILNEQITVMKNHIQVMNELLDPKQSTVNLPPISSNLNTAVTNQIAPSYEMGEKDIAVDAHFTASAMAKDNFNSSENMKNKQVKKLHSSMALQQATIAEAYEDLMNKMGWMNQPDASITEQTSVITTMSKMPRSGVEINQHPNH